MTVGGWLRESGRYWRGERGYLAGLLKLTLRTLQKWARSPQGRGRRRPGRPARSLDLRRAAYQAVRDVVRTTPRLLSWREVWKALQPRVLAGEELPRDLVSRYARAIKRARVKARAASVAASRQHIEVRAKNAVWALDGTHLDRDGSGGEVKGEVLSDAASTKVLEATAGPPPSSKEVAEVLKRAFAVHGTPLAIMLDNGTENRGEVEKLLRAERIIALYNLPHTPEHNPFAERRQRDLKEALAALDASHRYRGWDGRLLAACRILNEEVRRESRGWMTPADFHESLAPWYSAVSRDDFYDAACAAVAEAVKGIGKPSDRRMAEREAIFATLERFGLIRRTRGGARRPTRKRERIP